MDHKILSGAAIAVAVAALVLAGATPASARKHHHHHKVKAEKHQCNAKDGCPAKHDGGAADPGAAK